MMLFYTRDLRDLKLIHPFLQSIGYANLAKLDPQYGLCK